MKKTEFQGSPGQAELGRTIEFFLRESMGVSEFSENNPFADMGIDSMAILRILLLLEEKFGIYLPDSSLTWENIQSPAALASAAHRIASSRLPGN